MSGAVYDIVHVGSRPEVYVTACGAPRTSGRRSADVARRLVALVAALACGLTAAPAASAAIDEADTVVAVLDTGINAEHRAFDGQVVAWWDFTKGAPPPPGVTWDTRAKPYDDDGHGTGVAAMVAGRQTDPKQSPSLAPGTKLAIARVFDRAEGGVRNFEAAIRWAVHEAKADVINISIAFKVPVPGAPLLISSAAYKALKEAHAAGVLVVVGNGNGVGNTGVTPGDGASSPFSSSRHVLAVGASGPSGLHYSYNPEVSASVNVVVPVSDKPEGVRSAGGTSVASPFVAGFAAAVVTESCASGRPIHVDRLETLIKYSANDTVIPPSSEGYGAITAAELPLALEHARRGTLPGGPEDPMSEQYVEDVAGAERDLNVGIAPGSTADDVQPRERRCGAATATATGPEPGSAGGPPPASSGPAGRPSPASEAATAPGPVARTLAVRAARVTVRRGVATARFTLSAPARVALVVTRGRRVVARRMVAGRAGATTVRLGRVRSGRHALRLTARTADGAIARATARFRR